MRGTAASTTSAMLSQLSFHDAECSVGNALLTRVKQHSKQDRLNKASREAGEASAR